MKSHVKKLKSDAQYKWRSEGNNIPFNSNTENMEDLTQALWAIDNIDSSSESLAIGFASYYRAVSHPPSDVSAILISLLRCLSLSMQAITKSRA
jgi:hypothetical protein